MSITAGGSKQTSSANETSQNDLPDWLKAAYQSNLAGAQATAGQGFTPYSGAMAAGDNDYLSAARDQAVGATYAGRGQLADASNVYSQIANQNPSFFDAAQTGDIIDVNPERAATNNAQAAQLGQAATFDGTRVDPNAAGSVQAGSIPGSNLSAYLNPYQANVIDQSNAALGRQRQIVDDQNAYAASQAGAFGGSCHGVVDSENAKNFAQMQQENTNSLLNAGYDRATGLATSDMDRALQAGTTNQATMAQLLSGNADRGQAAGLASMDARNNFGLTQSQMNQQANLANASAANANSQFNAGQVNAAQTQNANLDYTARAADADRRQGGAIANAQIDQANTGFNLQGAQGLLGVANASRQQALDGAQALGSLGQQLQGTQQSQMDAAYNEFLRQQQDPFQRQELLNSALFGIGQGGLSSTTSNSKSKGSNIGVSASYTKTKGG